jgi:hypothetical protein
VFWCCPVFCCVYSVLSTIIFPFFPGHRVLCCSVFCCVYSVLSTIIFLFFLGHRVLVLPNLLLFIWCSVHHYFPLLFWSSCFGVAQSFVVYMVFCPPLFSSSFLVIVFWYCPVFCCLYGVQSTIIFPFFPGHRVLVLLSLLLSIWCSVHHYFPLLSWSSCFGVAQSFVVYMVFCPPLFSSSFLVIVC